MRINLIYAFVLLGITCRSQVVTFPFSNAFSIIFKDRVHVAGINNNTLTVYRLDPQLLKTDSFSCRLSPGSQADLLRLNADTLHGFLNLYLQKKEEAGVEIIRLNRHLKQVSRIRNVDVARLNNQAMLGSRPVFSGKDVYSISSTADSSGKQFFLNKYRVADTLENFDYPRSWQFAFERKFIHDAVILYAGRQQVLIYVNLVKPDNSSQWLLKVNSTTGKLVRGTKLNRKNESQHYMPGICLVDTSTGEVSTVGQKFRSTQLNLATGTFSPGDGQPALIYHCRMDSTGQIIEHDELKIPVHAASEGASKKIPGYILSFCRIAQDKNKIGAEADVFQSTGKPLCFRYANTLHFTILRNSEGPGAHRTPISGNRQLSDHIGSSDGNDLNGVICPGSAAFINDLYVTKPELDVKLGYKTDDNGNAVWLLKRSDLRTASVITSVLHLQGKSYGFTKGAMLKKETYPQIILSSRQAYVCASQINPNEYELKVYSW